MSKLLLPNFAIIGAQKSASTFVQRSLVDHPEVGMPPGETRAMEDPWYSEQSFDSLMRDLARQFGEKVAVGIKRPDCLAIQSSAIRLKKHLPDAKLVIILRNPIDRAISAYYHYMRYDMLPLLEVNRGLSEIMDGGIPDYPFSSSVLTYGLYGQSIQRYVGLFSQEQILVLKHDDILKNKKNELKKVFRFLGIAEDHVSKNLNRRSQAVVYSLERLSFLRIRSPFVFQWSEDRSSYEFRFGALSKAVWYAFEAVDRFLFSKFIASEKPALDENLRQRLVDYYKKDLELAEELTSLDLSRWLR